MLHQDIESDLGTSINTTFASKNHDFQDREFGPTVPAPSLEHSCGMMIRDMYLSLEPFGAQLDAKVRSYSKLGSLVSMDRTQSHSGPKEKTLPTPSPDAVLNGLFEDQPGRWKQGETSFGTMPTCGLVTLMPVPPKQGLSYTSEPC